jgi:hypothetical protein
MTRKRKLISPEELERRGSTALAKHERRGAFVPDIALTEKGWGSPYRGELNDHWWALFFDMLGTRQEAIVVGFLQQLYDLVGGDKWDETLGKKVTSIDGLRAALAQIQGMNVQNEAQLAYAAQLVALHLASMRLARGAVCYLHGDSRSVAVLAKATRAYGDGLLNLQRLQGKGPKKSHQTYRVERHVHNHQHVHLAGGAGQNGGQPHATSDAAGTESGAALPSPCPNDEDAMPSSCCTR